MPKAGGIPEKTNDFHYYLKTVVPHLQKNMDRLRIDKDMMEELQLHFGQINSEGKFPANSWNDLHERRSNPLANSSFVKQTTRAKRLVIDKLLREIYRNSVFKMNAEDKAITGRKRMPEKRGRAPVPDRAPVIFIRRQIHTVITLRFSDPEHPGLRRMPPAFPYILLEYIVIMGKGKQEQGNKSTGRWFFHLRLKVEHAGKKIRIRARYYNRRGNGPWSPWLEAFVI